MIDIESLSLSTTDTPILQIAAVPFDSEDTELLGEIRAFNEFFPLQPQLDLNRKINADTLGFWLDQPGEMLARIRRQCLVGNDPEELFALLRALNRKIDSVINSSHGDYEIWARGPQFDLVAIANLMVACGQTPVWHYSKVRDLRTLMATAGLSSRDVQRNPSLEDHDALDDCVFQISCYFAAQKALGSTPLHLTQAEVAAAGNEAALTTAPKPLHAPPTFGLADPTLPMPVNPV
jgi:hypothetical protein